MTPPLDERYFEWLYSQTGSVRQRNSAHTHWDLLRLLFEKEFIWFIPNDDNRAEDGIELRYEFLRELNCGAPNHWLGMGCSMLELLIGLSRRLAFEADRTPRLWFWELIDNLGFRDYNDATRFPSEVVNEVLDRVIWRTYHYDGRGGLFPLHNPRGDQRDIELWYQLSAYVVENF